MQSQVYNSEIYLQFAESLWDTGFYEEFVSNLKEYLVKDGVINATEDGKTKSNNLNIDVACKYYDSIYSNIYQGMESVDNLNKEFLQKLKYVYDFNSMITFFPDYKSTLLYVNNILFEIN